MLQLNLLYATTLPRPFKKYVESRNNNRFYFTSVDSFSLFTFDLIKMKVHVISLKEKLLVTRLLLQSGTAAADVIYLSKIIW